MSNNIFKDAKFGDKFITRDGRVALFIVKLNLRYFGKIKTCYRCIIEDEYDTFYDYDKNGLNIEGGYTELENEIIEYYGSDIVGKWQEPINDKNF